MYQKGKIAEIQASQKLHTRSLPLLISSVILRKRGCGQVDLACFENQKIYLIEIKSRYLGKQEISAKQRVRLLKSISFLGNIFNRNCELKVWDI